MKLNIIMHRVFAVSCSPEEETKIREYCAKNRLAVSKFLVQAAYEKMERDAELKMLTSGGDKSEDN